MARPDLAVVRDSFYATEPAERAHVEGQVEMARAVGHLRDSATQKFGEEGPQERRTLTSQVEADVKQLRKAREKITGDVAEVYLGGPDQRPTILVRVNGQWKISVARSYTSLERKTARLHAQAGAFDELATEIEAGKYALAAEARAAGTDKVARAMRKVEQQLAASTSRPAATAP